ncbi:MAG: cytochrome c [Rhodospirillaceae bacterium]|jgi:cytochrome c556
MPIQKFLAAFVCAFIAFGIAGETLAGPKDIIKYRKGVMKAVSGHMKGLTAIVNKKVDRRKDLKAHARSMHELAVMSATLFPQGTGPEASKTRALKAIWKDKAKYDKINDKWVAAAKALFVAADANDHGAAEKAFKSLKKSCKDCHKSFRAKKKRKKKK